MSSDQFARTTPRVILRTPRAGRFGEEEVLVLELGLGGAKFEHPERFETGRVDPFTCGSLTTDATVRHSVALPTKTGIVVQSGIEFHRLGPHERAVLLDLLVHEAQQQVIEWESTASGEAPSLLRRIIHPSMGAPHFIRIRHRNGRWERTTTTDPNQPFDGVTVVNGTPDDELAVLRYTYERGDDATRELLRRVATVAILEQMRG
jgi:hypothetical protein